MLIGWHLISLFYLNVTNSFYPQRNDKSDVLQNKKCGNKSELMEIACNINFR